MLSTDLPVEDLLLAVPHRLDDLKEGLEEPEVTESAGLIVELLPLCLLSPGKQEEREHSDNHISTARRFTGSGWIWFVKTKVKSW